MRIKVFGFFNFLALALGNSFYIGFFSLPAPMTKINPDNITNVVVTGKSGAGKQPRIDVLLEEFKLEQLSTGDIFRNYLGKFNDYGYKKDLDEFFDDAKLI